MTLSFLPPYRCHDLEVEFSGDFENVRPVILRAKSMSRVFVEIFNLVRKSEDSVGILVLVDRLFDVPVWRVSWGKFRSC